VNTAPTPPDRCIAEGLDSTDPLASWRSEFVVVDPDLIYLDGNSLGMTPKRSVDALRRAVEQQWAGDLITSWWQHDWLNLPLTVGNELAPLLGAPPDSVAVHDSTTVCIFQLINVALDLDGPDRVSSGRARPVIAVEDTEFPTDRYAAAGIARQRDGDVRRGLHDLDGVDVVIRSMVDYRTAEIVDVAAETARATAAGARTVWDLSHAVGVLDVDLPTLGVELAVGCTYKFLNGGPGSPAFTYITPDLHDRVNQPIWGWFGQTDQFAMDNDFEPRLGIGRMLHGTPGVLGLVGARGGIGVTAEAGIAAVQTKAQALTSYGIEVADQLDLAVASPREASRRGGHVAIKHRDAATLHEALTARKIIVDKREPDILRLGMSPLTTRFVDVHDALVALAELTA